MKNAERIPQPSIKPTVKKQDAKPDKELLRVLRTWNDRNAEALAASRASLTALGPDAFDQIVSLVRGRARLCRRILWFAGSVGSLLVVILFCWSLQHDTRQPLPVFLNGTLIVLSALTLISFLAAMGAVAGRLPVNAMKALEEQTTGREVGVLAELAHVVGTFSVPANSVSKAALLKAIENLLANENAPDLQLTKYQRRCLRRMLLSPNTNTDLTCTLLRLFTHLEEHSVLPNIRRLAAKSRNWEVREAAQDYLVRIVPAEVAGSRAPDASLKKSLLSAVTEEVDADNIPACVMALGSRNETERQTAETRIHRMGPEQIRQVLLMLDQESDAQQRRKNRITIALTMLAAMLLNLAWYPLVLRLPYFDSPLAVKATVGLMVLGSAIGWLIGLDIVRWQRNERRARQLGLRRVGVFPERRLLDTLQTLDNIAIIGTLIDALPGASAEMSSLTDSETNRAMRTALTALLPRLRASDAGLLSAAQRARLNHELALGRQSLDAAWRGATRAEAQAALDAAILKGWEQVGDEDALPIVQKLATQSARTAAQKQVKQAAQSCLPYLEARAGEQRAMQTLLRAADTPTESSDVLLRAAASGNTQKDSAQLLRANTAEE